VYVYFKKRYKNFPVPFKSVLSPPAESCADLEGSWWRCWAERGFFFL